MRNKETDTISPFHHSIRVRGRGYMMIKNCSLIGRAYPVGGADIRIFPDERIRRWLISCPSWRGLCANRGARELAAR